MPTSRDDIVTLRRTGAINFKLWHHFMKHFDQIYMPLKEMKNNGALEEDDVVTETIKIGGPVLMIKIQKLLRLCLWNATIPTKRK